MLWSISNNVHDQQRRTTLQCIFLFNQQEAATFQLLMHMIMSVCIAIRERRGKMQQIMFGLLRWMKHRSCKKMYSAVDKIDQILKSGRLITLHGDGGMHLWGMARQLQCACHIKCIRGVQRIVVAQLGNWSSPWVQLNWGNNLTNNCASKVGHQSAKKKEEW